MSTLLSENDVNNPDSKSSRKRKWADDLKNIFTDKTATSADNTTSDHDYTVGSTNEFSQSHFAGYIAYKRKRFSSCPDCLETFYSKNPKERDLLTVSLSRGFLTYPSDALFNLTALLEKEFLKEIGTNNLTFNTLFDLVGNISDIDSHDIPMVGCEKHKEMLTERVINHYLINRADKVCKKYNQIFNETRIEAKRLRKFSKLT